MDVPPLSEAPPGYSCNPESPEQRTDLAGLAPETANPSLPPSYTPTSVHIPVRGQILSKSNDQQTVHSFTVIHNIVDDSLSGTNRSDRSQTSVANARPHAAPKPDTPGATCSSIAGELPETSDLSDSNISQHYTELTSEYPGNSSFKTGQVY